MGPVHDLSLIFLIGFLLDAVIGDPQSPLHPVTLFGRYAGFLERKIRPLAGNGRVSGGIAWIAATLPVTALAGLAGWGLGVFGAGACLFVSIALRSLLEHADAIRIPLQKGDLEGGRSALARIVSRRTENLTESEVVRGAIESLSENLTDAVTSPCFWCVIGYLLGGVPGAAAGSVFLRAVNTLDACWGYRNERYRFFGSVAARTDDGVHWIPARMTALAIALVSGHPFRTFGCAWRHRHDHPSPNSCWSMAAFAGALRIRLGGPTRYEDGVENYPYWGTGKMELNISDLIAAEHLALRSALAFAALAWSLGIWI